eukprot:jgi/Tetstr1/460463/TSEL_005722.t1
MQRLTRAAYLHLANIDVQLFKTLNRRDQVPFMTRDAVLNPETAEEQAAKGYHPLEAVQLAIASDFARDGGLDRMTSKKLSAWDRVFEAIERANKGEEIWIAGYFYRQPGNGNARSVARIGAREELVHALDNYEVNGFRPAEHIYRIAMVNVSRILRQIHARAAEIGLDIGPIIHKA